MAVVVALAVAGCAATAPVKPTPPPYEPTPMPTVPPKPKETPTPAATPAPHPTVAARPGEPIGPIVTFFGAVRADGTSVPPASVGTDGIPIYKTAAGSGFILTVEVKPGLSGLNPGRSVFSYVPDDPTRRPDLQIQTSRNMGDGSAAVCDRGRPGDRNVPIGGVPGINPPSFKVSQRISDALNDFACRFETFNESSGACTVASDGDFSFISPESTFQFCMIVARAYAFPVGETTLTVRALDSEGNPGPTKKMRLVRPEPTKRN